MDISQVRNVLNEGGSAGIIFNLLLVAQPLTAKQVFYKLKTRHGVSISYQAVHKHLKTLLEEGVLRKDSLEYSINADWLDLADARIGELKLALKRRERWVRDLGRRARLFETGKRRVSVISFDLGGALFDNHYDELLWRTEIPKKYAERYGLSMEEAFERVTAEYRRLWGKVEGWRDPMFWLDHFDIDCTFEALTRQVRKQIKTYSDVTPLIRKLSKKYCMILITSAQRNIVQQKLFAAGLDNVFLKIYSTGEDFGRMTKDADIYGEICDDLRINPDEMIHVGNKYEFDYLAPSKLGIRAFLIDRVGDRKDSFVVRDLFELDEKLQEIERGAEIGVLC